MLGRERRVSFPGSYDPASLQVPITTCEKRLRLSLGEEKQIQTRIAQSASIRELFRASDHNESVTITEARPVEVSHKYSLFVTDGFSSLEPLLCLPHKLGECIEK